MRIYIGTPVNARKEATLEEKRKAAHRRCRMLKAWLKDEYPDAEILTPFDAVPLEAKVTEPEAMGRCITLELTCDAILLDRGWTASTGCNLEYRAAKLYGKKIIDGNGQIPE